MECWRESLVLSMREMWSLTWLYVRTSLAAPSRWYSHHVPVVKHLRGRGLKSQGPDRLRCFQE